MEHGAGPGRRNILMRKGFTLVELIIVIVIIGILATFAMPQFASTKERTLDKEAQANLKLIQAAEKIYRMEMATYYPDCPPCGSTSTITDINDKLKLSLPASSANWIYTVSTTGSSIGSATATRVGAGARVWTISLIPGASDIPTCTGTGCPSS